MSRIEIIGNLVVYCPQFKAGACIASPESVCQIGGINNCDLVAGGDSFAAACAAVVFLSAKYLAHNEWDEGVLAAIIKDVARMDARHPNDPDLVREELSWVIVDYFTDFQPPSSWHGSDAENNCTHCARKPFDPTNQHCTGCWYSPDGIVP